MTLYRAFFALFLAVTGLLIPAVPSAHAQTATCTTVWLVGPSYFNKFEAGAKRCIWPEDQENGWVKLYQFNDNTKPVIDWIPTWGYTKTRPNNGLVQSNADTVRAMADRYNVKVQFAVKARESYGCRGDFAYHISGTYYTAPGNPGQGLVRLGTGTVSTCMQDRSTVLNVSRHEISHALMERKCPSYIGEPRYENATDAYAWLFLNATTKSSGNYGFTDRDRTRAIEIAHKEC